MILYSKNRNARLDYTVAFIQENFFDEEIRICSNREEFNSSKELKVNYSKELFENCENINPEGILFEDHIRDYNDPFSKDLSTFLQADLFSKVFYAISRYEEYQIKNRDEHGRFDYRVLSKEKQLLIEEPFVDYMIIDWIKRLEEKYQRKVLTKNRFQHICTFDIDIAYAYLGRSKARIYASQIKNALKGKVHPIKEGVLVRNSLKPDPYDSYAFLQGQIEERKLESIFFFQLRYQGKYDKAIDPTSKELRHLIKHVDSFSKIGLHPSYTSHSNFDLLKEEKHILESLTAKNCTVSRQHFLKFDLPESYRRLIEIGINTDYSMGYSNASLFRAGSCFPFSWFDLKNNLSTKLRIIPLSWMDSTYIYNGHGTEKAEIELQRVLAKVVDVGGRFVSLWHNNHLGGLSDYSDWKQLFLRMLELCQKT